MADKKRPKNEPTEGVPEEGAPAAADAADAADETVTPDEVTEVPEENGVPATADGIEEDELTVQDILDAADLEEAEPSSEHLADLKRVTAEYANYRRRTEQGREVERERVLGEVVKVLLPVLDDIDRAEKHGDLEGDAPFATIAAKLRGSVERLGLVPFGAVGDPFDPNLHEAIHQLPTASVESDTVGDVVETGYQLGSTLLRAARVVVQVPSDG